MKIVAVTACPTGVAHTTIAARALEKAARSLGYEIKVEKQGALGIQNRLKQGDIDSSEVVIFAVDQKVVEEERFLRKQIYAVPVAAPIRDGIGVIKSALEAKKKTVYIND
jgi:fructose PTS system EIIB component